MNASVPLYHDGIAVSVTPILRAGGGFVFAEIVPAGAPWWRRLRPDVRRWWWEIHQIDGNGQGVTHAYTPGGSGGAYTLAQAMVDATDAVNDIALQLT